MEAGVRAPSSHARLSSPPPDPCATRRVLRRRARRAAHRPDGWPRYGDSALKEPRGLGEYRPGCSAVPSRLCPGPSRRMRSPASCSGVCRRPRSEARRPLRASARVGAPHLACGRSLHCSSDCLRDPGDQQAVYGGRNRSHSRRVLGARSDLDRLPTHNYLRRTIARDRQMPPLAKQSSIITVKGMGRRGHKAHFEERRIRTLDLLRGTQTLRGMTPFPKSALFGHQCPKMAKKRSGFKI